MTDDDTHWVELVGGVKPLKDKPKVQVEASDAPRIKRQRPPKVKVNERLPLRETPLHNKSPELLCGGHEGIDRNLRKKMDEGQLPIEARLDLHSLSIEQAYTQVCAFIHSSYARGFRLVLIVTGKGKGSIVGHQTIHQMFSIWLNANEMRNKIVRFCPANPKDGGEGAFYVLLRRKRS
ncbi:MAG: Smr/MutS family protein [Proteobacteria bacterium]|nr:Smr/MutS family protein [Pseudomonadota bacterium]